MNTEAEPMDSRGGGAERPPSLLRVHVDAWVVAAAVVISFAGGFVFGGLGEKESTSDPGIEQVPSSFATFAPPLDESQLQGELPSGHPVIVDPNVTTTGAPTASTPTTSAPSSATTTAVPAPPTSTAGG